MAFSSTTQTTLSPHSQEPYHKIYYPTEQDLLSILSKSAAGQKAWAKVPLEERIGIGRRFIEEFKSLSSDGELAKELTLQMGRPISQCAGEFRGMLDRAAYMLSIAPTALSPVDVNAWDSSAGVAPKEGFKRVIKRVPVGVVFVIAPWNFPYLTTINSVLPAIIAGNSVILKPSPQTPLTAERFKDALIKAGVPQDVIQVVHLTPALTSFLVQRPEIGFVSFTGSVENGKSVQKDASVVTSEGQGIKGVALELGGKDPAYVRPDADLDYTVSELVDGAFFNSGQSCCAVERIYVHDSVYDDFVSKYVELVKKYKLGDPTSPETNLGPVVSLASADRIRKQIVDAVDQGAISLVAPSDFPAAKDGTTYVAPTVLVGVDHSMSVMKDETFGPVIGIMKVSSDEEAAKLMNDSPFGLTASVWTKDQDMFSELEENLESGTVFMNRCDYLDPGLAWTGMKDSGRGVSLSRFGYDQLTKPKSVHMKIQI